MYQIESIFIGESQQDVLPPIKTEVKTEVTNNFRVGDVTRLGTNNFTLNCVQCFQSFRHFPEFTLHIEEHLVQGDVFVSTDNSDSASCLFKDENIPKIIESESNDRFIAENDLQFETIDDTKNKLTIIDTSEATFDLSQFIEGVTYKKVQNMYECLICGFKSAMKSNLKSHIAVHMKIKNILCPICMKCFSSVHYVQKHIKSIHKQTISAEAIRRAQRTLKQIVKAKKSDTDGLSKLKLNLLSSNYWRMEGKRYHCVLCVQWFTIPKYVQKHIRLVHGRHYSLDDILAAQIHPEITESLEKSNHCVSKITQKQIESLQREQAKDVEKLRVKSFECFACHTMFVSEKALRYHMPLHEGIQYGCPLCDKFFHMQKYVRDHMIYRHGFDKKSKLPPLKTRKIENFEYHKPIVSRFECYLCHRTYPSRSKLNSHMKSHLQVLECSICTKIFKSTESLRRHMQLHSADPNLQHYCSICQKGFPVRRYLMSHMRTSHRNCKSKSEKPSKAPETFTCMICQKVFDKQGMFNKHMKRHNKEPNRYMCDHCGDEFEDRFSLQRHLSSVHKISKRFFKCVLCLKVLSRKREEEHMKLHTGEKDHQCEICGNQFVTEGLLNTHKKRQHAKNTYQCDVCLERFKQPMKLLHHRRSHDQQMSHTCKTCNLGFFNVRSLTKHEAKKHVRQNTAPLEGHSDSN